MRVLLIDVNCKSGSTGKIAYSLFTELNKRGDTAAVCYGRGTKIKEANIFKFGIDAETYLHAFLTRITGWTGCYSFFSTRRLLKHLKIFKPDVVHIHELHAYFVNIKPIINYLKKNHIKTVWTFHCEFMYTGKCGYAYECEKWKTECGHCTHKKDYPSSILFDCSKKMFQQKKRLFDGFDNLTIVTPSQWLADRVRLSFLKDKNIAVIHNGIDANVFCPQNFDALKEKHQLQDEKIVLAVAPDLMDERKGGRWVLQLAENMKQLPIKFILIGVKDLKEQFPDNVIALGRTENQTELAKYYSIADVFVICSKRENFPTTCVEALCCGAPVVGFDTGGTKETAPLSFGKFVEYHNVEELQNKIQEILHQVKPDKAIVEYASMHYSQEVMFQQYDSIYCGMNDLSVSPDK